MVNFFIGFVLAFAVQSAYRIVKILLANRKEKRERTMQERTESKNNKSVDD